MPVLKAFGIAVALVALVFVLAAFVAMRPIPWVWDWSIGSRAALLVGTAYLTLIVWAIRN